MPVDYLEIPCEPPIDLGSCSNPLKRCWKSSGSDQRWANYGPRAACGCRKSV